jgi:RNA polymerase sigma factor (sigma-70 family)
LIGKLSDEERKVVELLYYPERSYSEVARLLTIDRETVRRREQKALERLGRWLRGSDGEDFGDSGDSGGSVA